ncbi:DMT family transporter [Brevibacterium sp. 50QC2O2]|jgi:drug/metabolite transporter (DMT)-like permease|uniref:EamA family transporter n=1 Tax=Brevibacterium TaxID=1696 RepID=UPI00211C0A21|nr:MULTISPECIES: DMT family transporter [unclassified Brevibacterium]MCQ9369090.1 DMT family transporter [Brevibacterium sp. 91QC2O2]MCQ9385066.1 DMT family transporter [Brevibacterium sp. 68QC2CO]MCQ9387764.1 DMT family transporter [Brevibacterium sp. 50QC2O2]
MKHGFATGVVLTLLSNLCFALAGPIAKAMYATGWTPGPVVFLRLAGCAAVLAVPTLVAMHSRWHLLGRYWKDVVSYGVISMAGVQLLFFLAVERMQVSIALLLEMTAPLLIVFWLWIRTGVRPAVPTLVGMVCAVAGLLVVLDPRGADLNLVGVLFALGAACCLASFFMVSAKSDNPIPPIPLLGLGMFTGALLVLVVCLSRVIDVDYTTAPVHAAGYAVPWWLAMAAIVGLTVGAYAFGVWGLRYVGASLGAFINLLEVPISVLASWWLLRELPHAIQGLGGVLILAGVVFIKVGENRQARRARIVDLGDVEAPAAVRAPAEHPAHR